jgi:hypothetical protein
MAGELFSYRGQVPEGGFRLVQARRADPSAGSSLHSVLVQASPGAADQPVRTYDLLGLDVILYRLFGQTTLDGEGVLAFANQYGGLGTEVDIEPATKDAIPFTRGELLEEWRKQISLMRQLVTLWDLHQAGNTARLTRHFRWEKDDQQQDQVIFRSHVDDGTEPSALGHFKTRVAIALAALPSGLQAGIPPQDIRGATLAYLRQRLDEQLRLHERRAAPLMAWDSARGQLVLRFAASSLASALWMQLADAVANERSYARCQTCSKWFEVAPEAARSHRRFCSVACRTRSHRQRQERARRMYFEQKMPFEVIAKFLDSKVVTVKRWITGAG